MSSDSTQKWGAAFFAFLCLLILCFSHFSILWQEKPLYRSIGQLPVQHEGRVKAFESLARSYLSHCLGKDNLVDMPSSTELLFTLINQPQALSQLPYFKVEHPDLQHLFQCKKRASLHQLDPHKESIQNLSLNAQKKEEMSPYESQLIHLHESLFLSYSLMNSLKLVDTVKIEEELAWGREILATSPTPSQEKAAKLFFDRYQFLQKASLVGFYPQKGSADWKNLGHYVLEKDFVHKTHPLMEKWISLSDNPSEENASALQQAFFESNFSIAQAAYLEYWLVKLSPFAFLAKVFFLLFLYTLLTNFIFNIPSIGTFVFFAFFSLLYFLALLARMLIYNRPPVTDLASSALFIGLSCILLSWILSFFSKTNEKNNLPVLLASFLAATCLQLSLFLSQNQDPFSPLRAVLDSNFWLSTHVVVITLGYSFTLFSSLYATTLILSGPKKRALIKHSPTLYKLTFLSLVTVTIGTALGGVWADQSWGRFWGWDPKENGALMICLWQALLLHGKKLGVFKAKTFVVLISLGSIITSWSWFGVNMLGVGLHSYGFIDQGFFFLVLFILLQLSIGLWGWKAKER